MIRTNDTTHISLTDLETWFLNARAGDQIVYAIGDLMHDRGRHIYRRSDNSVLDKLSVMPDSNGALLAAVAGRALQLHSYDLIWLFQRRVGDSRFEYIAMRRPARDRYAHGVRVPADIVKEAMAALAGRVIKQAAE